jgi:CxxC motif-containing protein (DUF1111 family)
LRTHTLCIALLLAAGCAAEPHDPITRLGEPLALLSDTELGRFLLGRAVFERIAMPEEGLGPLFNADRCSACHDQPAPGGTGSITVLKATGFDGVRCDVLEDAGGDNVQQRTTPRLAAHGMSAEPLHPRANTTTRVIAPPLFGLGLLAAIPDAVIAALADPDDANGDGVSGRAPQLDDGRIARFGRKGETATIEDFVDTALRFELGLTTPANPHEELPAGEQLPPDSDPLQEPEIEAYGVGLLADYTRFLAPPAPALPATAAARDSSARGQRVFEEIGCTSCHTPELRTGASTSRALHRVRVRAYSDLLLHDMGEGLASVCGLRAGPGEWRTAPLWGVRHRQRYLYDGRATDLGAAIDAHGGEAASARGRWQALDTAARARLLAFLNTL